jgi:thioredoxin-like negative regulator of GroEL
VTEPLIAALRRAAEASPEDVGLRLQLADLLAGAGRLEDAIYELADLVQRDPANAQLRASLARKIRDRLASFGLDNFDWDAAERQFRPLPY